LKQALQLPGSDCRFAQTVVLPVAWQSVKVGPAQTQAEVWQASLSRQAMPQPPQLRGSLRLSTQAVGEGCGHWSGNVDGHPQTPAAQASFESGQAAQPLPQCLGSTAVSTQAGLPPQSFTEAGLAAQEQAPLAQVPRPQAWPHAPQWASLGAVAGCLPRGALAYAGLAGRAGRAGDAARAAVAGAGLEIDAGAAVGLALRAVGTAASQRGVTDEKPGELDCAMADDVTPPEDGFSQWARR
jgi:hypothetical protein